MRRVCIQPVSVGKHMTSLPCPFSVKLAAVSAMKRKTQLGRSDSSLHTIDQAPLLYTDMSTSRVCDSTCVGLVRHHQFTLPYLANLLLSIRPFSDVLSKGSLRATSGVTRDPNRDKDKERDSPVMVDQQ